MTEHEIEIEVVMEVRRRVKIKHPAVSRAVAVMYCCKQARETYPGNCTARLLAGEKLKVKKVKALT